MKKKAGQDKGIQRFSSPRSLEDWKYELIRKAVRKFGQGTDPYEIASHLPEMVFDTGSVIGIPSTKLQSLVTELKQFSPSECERLVRVAFEREVLT
jgi:hypothetical protein